MASTTLEEKIEKIRLQNEKIRQRYEEVEADKKNAAKSNALVQLVPSDVWPERKEPPEFSAPPKNTQKPKALNKESDRPLQHYASPQERISKHKFNQGDGPPPDPKYNYLADSERDTYATDDSKIDEDKNKSKNKTPRGERGPPRKRGGASGFGGGGGSYGNKDAFFKDNRGPHSFHSREGSVPEYEAWRAERDRIDEARINRQKTAEGNWRREWDNNKADIEKDVSRSDRRNNYYDNDHSNRGYGGTRTYHGSQKIHGNQDYRRPHELPHDHKKQTDDKQPLSPTDDRTITTSEKNIKVTVGHGTQIKGPLMSVKVNSPSIAGTGRVGPRQKSRFTYSSQSDADANAHQTNNFPKQKSFDEKTTAANFDNGQKPSSKSPFPQRKKENISKTPHSQKKDLNLEEFSTRSKNQTRSSYSQKNGSRDQKQLNINISKPQRTQKKVLKPTDVTEANLNSDEAIPSEYNPNRSSNNENSSEQKVHSNSHIAENNTSTTDEKCDGTQFLSGNENVENNDDQISENQEHSLIAEDSQLQESIQNSKANVDSVADNENVEGISNVKSNIECSFNVKPKVQSSDDNLLKEDQRKDYGESISALESLNNLNSGIQIKSSDDTLLENNQEEPDNGSISTSKSLKNSNIEVQIENSDNILLSNYQEKVNSESIPTSESLNSSNIEVQVQSSNDIILIKNQENDNESIPVPKSLINLETEVQMKSSDNTLPEKDQDTDISESISASQSLIISKEKQNDDLCSNIPAQIESNILNQKIELHEEEKESQHVQILDFGESEKIEEIKNQETIELKDKICDFDNGILEINRKVGNSTNDAINLTESKDWGMKFESSENTSANDSGFIDNDCKNNSSELDETKSSETDNLIEKLDDEVANNSNDIQKNIQTPLVKSVSSNEVHFGKTELSDLLDTSVEMSKESDGICDISSTASNEFSEAFDNSQGKTSIQKSSECSEENLIQNGEDKIVEHSIENIELSVCNEIKENTGNAEDKNIMKDELTKVTVEELKEE